LWNWIVNLMAGNRFDLGMPVEVIDYIALFNAAVAMFGIEAGEALAEVPVEDILKRRAGVFEDVVVEDDEAQGRSIPEDLVAREFQPRRFGGDNIALDLQ
jgi:hypothetical protein